MVGKMKVETEAAKGFEICQTDILKDHLLEK